MLRTRQVTLWSFLLLLLPQLTTAQDHCDSLTIQHLRYHPFTDTLMTVRVDNTSSHFFSNPFFQLLSAENDTLAVGVFAFFGISQVPQTHHLALRPGVPLPATPFTGGLVLYSFDWTDQDTCTWAVETELCPPGPCTPLNVYLYSLAGNNGPFTTSFNWTVSALGGTAVASGTLAIDADQQQQAIADLCLPPGQYMLHLEQPEDIGLLYTVGLCQEGDQFTNIGPAAHLQPGGAVDLPFDYYLPCFTGTNSVPEAQAAAPTLMVDGRVLRVRSADGAPLGELRVVDTTGRQVLRMKATSASAALDLLGAPAGVYLLSGAGAWPAMRFVLD